MNAVARNNISLPAINCSFETRTTFRNTKTSTIAPFTLEHKSTYGIGICMCVLPLPKLSAHHSSTHQRDCVALLHTSLPLELFHLFSQWSPHIHTNTRLWLSSGRTFLLRKNYGKNATTTATATSGKITKQAKRT